MSKCDTCRHDGEETICAECVGFKKWKPKVEIDPYAELKAAAKDPTKQIRWKSNGDKFCCWLNAGDISHWKDDAFYRVLNAGYEIRDKPIEDHANVLNHLLIDRLRARLGADDQTDADQLIELLDQRLAEKSHMGTPAVILLREDDSATVHDLADGEDPQAHAMSLVGEDDVTMAIAIYRIGTAVLPDPKPVWMSAHGGSSLNHGE